ncbi:hypothetical protein GUA87_04815 [Sneathiella sp. P13V-1]|uniref:GTP-binding protein n=1 Tax=Sneathiella sp. P13V-1 TaxID=2697366 RepID=UPI00187BC09C|nr:GTP-binding protein [Sneathiella sp. P13V-1]MBE7636155.1 hypothetical protein [Sneathiella sp. P13V-1]
MTPVCIISGYLGAGKTTLIQEFLENPGPWRACVLVNDFGKINLDAALIAETGADTIALTNGCACCSIGDDLLAAVQKVMAGPAEYDLIIVEASGVAQPGRLKMLVAGAKRTKPARCLTVVNLSKAKALSQDKFVGRLFKQQADQADGFYLNRGADTGDLLPLDKPRFTSLIDFLAFEALPDAGGVDGDMDTGVSPLFRQEFVSLEEGMSEADFNKWCENLPSNVHRAKGYVTLLSEERQLKTVKVDLVQGHLSTVLTERLPVGQCGGLVLISVAGAA